MLILYDFHFATMRGVYKACFGHTELHPYIERDIEYDRPSLVPGSTNTESHTLAALVVNEMYSWTYTANKIGFFQQYFARARTEKEYQQHKKTRNAISDNIPGLIYNIPFDCLIIF